MIKREDLKIGESYYWCDVKCTLTAIGERSLLVKYAHNIDETIYSTECFIENYSLAPRPKKKIKLIGYMTLDDRGNMMEFREYLEGYNYLNMKYLKKISEREIEVEQ